MSNRRLCTSWTSTANTASATLDQPRDRDGFGGVVVVVVVVLLLGGCMGVCDMARPCWKVEVSSR